MQHNENFPAPELIGAFKTFGPFGPAYQVMSPVRQLEDGDRLVKIHQIETGEDLEYRYTHALSDPKAA